jgi:Fur family transcriptional regulator, peroxide stress response regulator
MVNKTAVRILVEKGLKVTPQRIAVLDILLNLENHPAADTITEYLRLNYPHVPIGTVYKILDVFLEKGIVNKVQTENGIIRFDPVTEKHHHLYSLDSERIEDFYDPQLNKILEDYFSKNQIQNFKIEDIKVHLKGRFTDNLKSIK